MPILAFSIYLVKSKKNYAAHKKLQIFISTILGVAILIFEVDVRLNGWLHLAKESVYYDTFLWPLFYLHLTLAILTTLLWVIVFWRALKNFSVPVQPNEHSPFHKSWAPWASIGLFVTTLTGITFYYAAFL